MALTIDTSTSSADSGAATASAAIDSALAAQVAVVESANADAVLSSIGLGANISTSA